MDSTANLTHRMFLAALGTNKTASTKCHQVDWLPGCRCQDCYSKEEEHSCDSCFRLSSRGHAAGFLNPRDHRSIGDRVPSLRKLFAGDNTGDFAGFFYGKLMEGSREVCTDEERDELEDTFLVYSSNGLEYLYRDLEYSFINLGWTDTEALGKVFAALSGELMSGGFSVFPLLEVHASGAPRNGRDPWPDTFPMERGSGFLFRKRYEDRVSPRQDFVRLAFLSGNLGFLEELLKFGATMFKPQVTVYEMSRVKDLLLVLTNGGNHDLQGQVDTHYKDILKKQYPPSARRRLLLVTLGLETFVKIKMIMNPEAKRYHKGCLKRVFQTIPEPKIRSSEIKELLTKLLLPLGLGSLVIEAITKDYESCFPESAKAVTPRSLKHLSRVEVRHSLKGRGCFIKDMLHLDGLPQTLKQYLDLGLFSSDSPTVFGNWVYDQNSKTADTTFPRLESGIPRTATCLKLC